MPKIFSNLISSKINPIWIIKNHINTLVDGRGNRHRADFVTFFIFPLIPAIIFKFLGATLDGDMVGIINTGLALFAGLFLSVSVQLIVIDKSKLTSEVARKIQKQTISNISFLILTGLVAIIMSYFSLFQGVESKMTIIPFAWYKIIIDIIVYWLIGVFMLTVLMILKRATALFEHISK